MANRYWVGGAGTWDTSSTTNWSASSGGSSGASVPTSADSVFFDSGSGSPGNITCVGILNCLDLTVSVTGWTITSGTATFNIKGSLLLNSGTTWSGTVTGSAINFTSTLWGNTITTNGVKLGVQQVEFIGVGGNWTLGSSITIGLTGIAAGNIIFTNGTFDTSPNSYSINAYVFGLGIGTKTINLNNSTMTIGGTNGSIWNISALVTLNTNFNTGTSTIVLSGSFSIFGGGFNFYNVNFSSTTYSQATITGNNTFNNLTISSRGSSGLNNFSFDSDQRINGTLTFTSPIVSTYRQCLKSDTIGTPRTLTINAISGLTDIDFRDITIAGAVGTISGTRLSDCGGNSGITFPAAKTVYFIGTTFDSSGWATSSGGTTSFANYPLAQDTIIIDDNSVASGTTITISYTTGQNIGTLDFRNRTLSLGLILFTSTHNVYGSYYMPTVSATYGNGGDPTFCGRGIQNFSAPNVVSGTWNNLFISSPNTTLKILGNTSISAINGVQLVQGTFDLNGYTFTMGGFGSTSTTTRTLNFNNGKIVVAGSSWNTVTSTGLTILGSGTISMTSASAKTFTAGAGDYSNITLSQDGVGLLTISGTTGYKLGKLTNTVSPTTINFASSITHSIGNLSLNGTAGNLVTIGPQSAATVYTLKSETGWAHKCSYCSVSYMTGTTTATDGQTVAWRFAFSTNTAGNTNLTFVTTYFWVGGTGTWDAVTTTNWSLTSGGAGSTGPPTAADNVIFDSNSGTGTVTFSGVPVGYDVTIGGTGITIAGTVPILFSGSCTILASTTWSYSSTITMNAVTKGHLITTNGVTLSNSLTLNGLNGGWSLGSALNLGSSGLRSFTINQGTFNTNNYNITAGTLTVGSSGTSIVSATYLGSSTLTIYGVSGTVFLFRNHNNTVFDSGTSTIISGTTGANFTFYYRPIKLYNVSIQTTSNDRQSFYDGSSSVQSDIGGVSYTFNNLTITSTVSSAVNLLLIDTNITVNGTLTFVGNSITQRQMLCSRTYGKIQLYANTIVGLSDIDFRDIVATGPATWSGTRLGDCGGNSGITFDAPKTVYYSETVSNSGSNITTTKWATTSGGTGNTNNFPLAQDTIVIDNNSSATGASSSFILYPYFSYKKIIISNRTNPLTLQTNNNVFSDDFIIPSSITLIGQGATLHSTYGSKLNFSVNPVTDTSGYIYLTGLGSVKLTNNCTFKTIGVSGGVSLELNDYNLNVFNVELSGLNGGLLTFAPSAYRTIDFASTSVINVSGNNSVVWNESISYGPSTKSALRVKGNSVVNFTYSGSTGTRTIVTALPAQSYNSIFDDYTIESNSLNFNITAGTDIVDLSSAGFFVRSLNFTGFSGTLTRQTSGNCFINGNLTLSSGMTFTGFTGVNTYFNATQGTQIITSNGKTFLGPGSINIGSVATQGLGLATVQLIDNFTTDNVINSFPLNQGILDLNNNTLTCPTFSINSATTYKAINFRTSGQINLNSAASASVSIWSGNSGSFYIYGTPTVNVTDAGTATFTRTISTTGSINPINFNIQAGVAGSIFSFVGSYGNLNFTGCSSTINNSALTILGSVNLGSTATFTAGATAWTFAPRKLETFTSNAITVDWPITINATEVNSGTLQLQDNTTIGATRTLTLTQGVLDLNSKTLNVGLFVSNNSNVRTVAFGASGIMNITATTTSTVFDTTTSDNITVTGSRTVNISGAAASGITRTINPANNSGFSAGYFDINLTGGAAGSTITFGLSRYVRNLNFTGTSSTITQVPLNILGNLNLGSTATFTAGANSWAFFPPGGTTATITTNAKTVDWPILLSGTGTLVLQDSLTMGTTRAFTINVGVVNLNGFTLTAATMSVLSQGTNPAGTNNVIGSSPSQIVLTGTGAVWNWGALTGTVISVPPILLTDTSTTARTMTMGAGVNYQKITIGGTTGISTTTITGTCYVGEWASTKTVAHTILFSSSSQQNFNKWSITGTAGNVVTIGPLTAALTYNFLPSSRVTGVDYLSISYCSVSPFVLSGAKTAGAEFYAGTNSTDGGGNTRFIYFTAAPTATTRYWVGGTGTWDATTTTNWSTSSGGSGGASVPTSVDNVIFDSASSSGNYTVSRGAIAIQTMVNDLTISAPASGTLSFGSGGVASLTIFGSLSIAATGVTLGLSGVTIAFLATTTGKTITTNGLSGFGNPVNFFGVGGEWTLGSSFSAGTTGSLYLNAGSLITANYNVTAASLNSTSYLPRSINLGSSTVTFSGLGGTILPVNSDSNLTWNAGTSSIILNTSANPQTIIDAASTPLGLTFYNFTYNISTVGGLEFNGSYTFNNLTIGSGRPTGVVSLIFYANQTINGTLTLQTPTNGNARTLIYGNSSLLTGTQRTLTINAVTNMTDVDFRDIKIAGAVGTLTGTRIGDCTNNSGITFDTPKIVYCTSSGNQWQSNCWSTTPSGTPSYDNFPLAQDTIRFDNAANIGDGTGSPYHLGTIDLSTRNGSFSLSITGGSMLIYGNVILNNSTTLNTNSFYGMFFLGTNNQTFTSNGSILIFSSGAPITISKSNNSSFILGDALNALCSDVSTSGAGISLTQGILDLNGYNLTTTTFNSTNSNTRSIKFNGAAIFVVGGGASNQTVWNTVSATNLTFFGKPDVYATYRGGTPATNRNLLHGNGGLNFNHLPNFYITGGNDTVIIWPTSYTPGDLDFTGFSGILSGPQNGAQLGGNLTLSPNMSIQSSAFALSFVGPRQKTIKTNGQVLDIPLTINFASTYANIINPPSLTLLDNLTLGPTSNGNFSITGGSGNFYANNFNVTSNTLTISNVSQNYFVNWGNGNWTVTGSTVILNGFGAIGTSYPGNATIFMTSTNTKTLTGPAAIVQLPKICQAGNGTLSITGNAGQFNDIFANTFPSIITLGSAISCNNFTLSGRAGALVTLNSSVAATGRAITKVGGGTVSTNYLSIQDSLPVATGTSWYAGPNSTRVSNFGVWSAANAPNSNIIDII